MRRFLEYVVDEELDGRGDQIKAYSIATSALDRSPSFDPQADPIVRVTGSKLRGNLELYYATDGQNDPIHIAIPTGTYRPAIAQHGGGNSIAPEHGTTQVRRWPARHRSWITALVLIAMLGLAGFLAATLGYLPASWFGPASNTIAEIPEAQPPVLEVLPFAPAADRRENLFASGLRHQLIVDLAQFKSIRVRESVPGETQGASSTDALLLPAIYRISGAVHNTGDDFRLGLALVKAADDTVMWSRNIRFPGNDFTFHVTLLQTINAIAAEIASETGVVHMDALNRLRVRTEVLGNRNTSEYECLLLSYAYDNAKTEEDEAAARTCLQERTSHGSKNSSLWAAWALMRMLDWTRQGKLVDDSILQEALAAARRAVTLDPANSVAYANLGSILSVMGNRADAITAYERGLELNPSNPALHFHIGWQRALGGDWEGGMPLIKRAIALSPVAPGYMRIALSIDAFRREDYETALGEAETVLQSGDERGTALAYAAAVGLHDRDLIRRYAAALRQTEGFDPADPIGEIRRAFSNPDVMRIYDQVLSQSPVSW